MITLYINNVDQTSKLIDYTFTIGLNTVPSLSLEVTLPLKINDKVKLVDGTRTLFNGFLPNNPTIDMTTNIHSAEASGNIVQLDLLKSAQRKTWTNSSSSVIVPEIIGSAFTIGSVDNYSPLTISDEYGSPLLAIIKMALACKTDPANPTKVNNNVISTYDFWVDEVDNKFYFKKYRGSLTSQATLVNNTDIWNAKSVGFQGDIVNSVRVLGSGDGVNQINRQASNLYVTSLSSLAVAGNLSIQLSSDDYQSYVNSLHSYSEAIPSGTGLIIKIGSEEMGVSGGNATNHTLTVLATDRGLNSTTLSAHGINSMVLGGSVLKNGLRQKTLYDRSTIDSNTAFDIAQSAVSDLAVKKESLDFNIEAITFWIGDVITIDGTQYRVLNITTGLNMGIYQVRVGYVSRGQLSILERTLVALNDGSVYAQGATNIYSVQDNENCDSSHPFTLKFYIPPEAVRINHVKLNFTIENYRAYSNTVASNSSVATSTASGGANISVSDTKSHNHTLEKNVRLRTWNNSQSGTFHPYVIQVQTAPTLASTGTPTYINTLIWAESTLSNKDIILGNQLFGSMNNTSHSHNVSIPNHTHNLTIPGHTHNIGYGIFEEPLTSPSLGVSVNGSNVGTYTANSNDIDIASHITSSGWHTVVFTPNKRMKVNANIYIQVYIQSK